MLNNEAKIDQAVLPSASTGSDADISQVAQKVKDGVMNLMGKIEDNFGLTPCMSCAITYGIMNDPVVTSDGHSYERKAIEQWEKAQAQNGHSFTSPMTREELKTSFVKNTALRNLIQTIEEKNQQVQSTASNTRQALGSLDNLISKYKEMEEDKEKLQAQIKEKEENEKKLQAQIKAVESDNHQLHGRLKKTERLKQDLDQNTQVITEALRKSNQMRQELQEKVQKNGSEVQHYRELYIQSEMESVGLRVPMHQEREADDRRVQEVMEKHYVEAFQKVQRGYQPIFQSYQSRITNLEKDLKQAQESNSVLQARIDQNAPIRNEEKRDRSFNFWWGLANTALVLGGVIGFFTGGIGLIVGAVVAGLLIGTILSRRKTTPAVQNDGGGMLPRERTNRGEPSSSTSSNSFEVRISASQSPARSTELISENRSRRPVSSSSSSSSNLPRSASVESLSRQGLFNNSSHPRGCHEEALSALNSIPFSYL